MELSGVDEAERVDGKTIAEGATLIEGRRD
jgi:hypothetical protein